VVDLFGLSAARFETFVLVFVRVRTLLFVFPLISARQVPMQVRFGLGLVLSLILCHTVKPIPVSADLFMLGAAVASQVLLGLVVGYVAALVFAGIQFAGSLIDLQMGFAVANVLNPATQQNVTIVSEFQLAIATLVFLATNSHYVLITGIARSFTLAPLPYVNLDPAVAGDVMIFFTQAFLMVFRIAAPAITALFLTNVALALMARVAPQMNVFVIGLPMQVGVGLVMLALSLPLIAIAGTDAFQAISGQMNVVMHGLRASP
jgi:flagellar biosynthetic protein FliR